MTTSQLKRVGELDLAEDIAFERASWKAQRIAWIIMALILAAALLGAFGHGWLSQVEARSADGALEVQYNRYIRFQSPTELRFRFAPSAQTDNAIGLWVSRDYLNSMEIKQITPATEAEIATSDGIIYIFNASGSDGPLEALFRFEVQSAGSMHGSFAIAHADQTLGERLLISQWAYP